MSRSRQTVLLAGTLHLLLGVALAGNPPVTVVMSGEPVGEADDKTYQDTFNAVSSVSGHESVMVVLMPAELGMPGPLSLPTEDGQKYTVVVLQFYSNGRSEQVDFANLADEHARAFTEETFAAQMAEEYLSDVASTSGSSSGSLDAYVIPGIQCSPPLWRFRICYWELPNGQWKITINWLGDDGHWREIFDSGYQQPARSAVADAPPVTFEEVWGFIKSHAGHAPDVLAEVAAVLEEYAGSYLDSLGVAHPWIE